MADLFDTSQARKLLEQQLKTLEAEAQRMRDALAALGGEVRKRGPGRPRGSTSTRRRSATRSTGTRRRAGGRRARRGSRADEAVKIVKAKPGSKISEIAKEMGIAPNYLYRVLPALQKDGLVRKDGRGWHPLEAA